MQRSRAAAPRRALPLALVALLALPALALALAPAVAEAEPPEPLVRLPTDTPVSIAYAAVATDGVHVYLFGGWGLGDRILRFDPATETFAFMEARLPGERSGAAAVWTGSAFYVFGGCCGLNATVGQQVVRYEPATDTVTLMEGKLPSRRDGLQAVWDGTHAYIVGGGSVAQTMDILRYDPAADMVTRTSGLTPGGANAAAFDGRYVWSLGGYDGWNRDEVIRYDPQTDTYAYGPRLPEPRAAAGAFWDGSHVFVMAGNAPGVVRFDPAARTMAKMHGLMPHLAKGGAVAWTGEHAYVFGGHPEYRAVLRYTPALDVPNAAPQVRVAPVPPVECVNGRGTVTLDASASHDPDGDALGFGWWTHPWWGTIAEPGAATTTGTFALGSRWVQSLVSDGRDERRTSFQVHVVDTQPPTVALTRPTPGALYVGDVEQAEPSPLGITTALGPLTLLAAASDTCAMDRVTLRIPGEPDQVRYGPPWRFVLDPSLGAARVVKGEVIAQDAAGHRTATAFEVFQADASVVPPNSVPGALLGGACRLAGAPEACGVLVDA